ncbi:MAG TPA: pilus assembly protein TadG-related protein [Bryobacteraceae bacterium]|nr:pilus assembly protein TadG-related protein [Bryobacteraceae bacterium]
MFKALSVTLRPLRIRIGCERLQRRRRGFVVIAFTLSAVFLLGVTGLAFDVGRMYVARSEAQSFVDSAALQGALQMDGTKEGLAAAVSVAQSNLDDRKRWAFNTASFAAPDVTFSTTAGSGFKDLASIPNPPIGYKFIRVAAKVNVPLTLLRVVVTASGSDVAAGAVATQVKLKTIADGVFPFAPMAPNPAATTSMSTWGFQEGVLYTLQWASVPDIDHPNTTCPGDANAGMIARFNIDQNNRGFIVNQASASEIQTAIINGTTDYPISEGDTLMTAGTKETETKFVNNRVDSDLDPSHLFADYLDLEHMRPITGNSTRIVIIPVNSGPPDRLILGFARFLLQPSPFNGMGGNKPLCGWYMGSGLLGGDGKPVEDDGIYRVALVR